MKLLAIVVCVFLAPPARAQTEWSSVSSQARAVLSGAPAHMRSNAFADGAQYGGAAAPAPVGVAVPLFKGTLVAFGGEAASGDYKGTDFSLRDLAGNRVTLSQFAGKHVLIDFSATWCGPCNAAIPKIQETHARYAGQGLAVLAVYAEDADTVREHMNGKGVSYPILVDPADGVRGRFGARFFPTFVLIGPDGSKLGMGVGKPGLDQMVEKFKKAAAAAPAR